MSSRVHDPPTFGHMDQVQQVDVAVAEAPNACDAAAEVLDLDLDPSVGGVFAPAFAVGSGVDHILGCEGFKSIGIVSLYPAAALHKLGVERLSRALRVPVEPAFDVVAHCCSDRVLISANCHHILHACDKYRMGISIADR